MAIVTLFINNSVTEFVPIPPDTTTVMEPDVPIMETADAPTMQPPTIIRNSETQPKQVITDSEELTTIHSRNSSNELRTT